MSMLEFCLAVLCGKVFFMLGGLKMERNVEIMDSGAFMRTLKRLAHEIVENNSELSDVALVGILRRGATIADMLGDIIFDISGVRLPIGYIDITLYRDDLKEIGEQPSVRGSKIDFDVSGKTVILIDDVIFTGRTVRAAMEAVIEAGRPRRIRLCVMIDRGHRELPIRADYIGKNVPTSMEEQIKVMVEAFDGEFAVRLVK